MFSSRPYQADYGRKYLTGWQTKEKSVFRGLHGGRQTRSEAKCGRWQQPLLLLVLLLPSLSVVSSASWNPRKPSSVKTKQIRDLQDSGEHLMREQVSRCVRWSINNNKPYDELATCPWWTHAGIGSRSTRSCKGLQVVVIGRNGKMDPKPKMVTATMPNLKLHGFLKPLMKH